MTVRPPRDRQLDRILRRPWIDPHLKEAADACRLVGGLFILLGALPMFAALASTTSVGITWRARAAAIGTTVVLLGPGVWYCVASRFIRRGDARAARVSLWVVGVQAFTIVFGLGVDPMLTRGAPISFPALLAVFFLPALGVTAFHLVRARRVAAANAETPAFEPIAPKPVLPVLPLMSEVVTQPVDETPPPRLRPSDGGNANE